MNWSGVFFSGTEDAEIHADLIRTKDIYTNALLKQGTADRISGGVFTVTNAYVDCVKIMRPQKIMDLTTWF